MFEGKEQQPHEQRGMRTRVYASSNSILYMWAELLWAGLW